MASVIKTLSFAVFFIPIVLCTPAQAAEEFDPLHSGLRMLWGLLVVLAVMFILFVVLRKKLSSFQQPGKGIIKVLETKHLPQRKSLMLVEVRGKEFLVGMGSDSIQSIVPVQGGSSFSSILDTAADKQ